MFSPDLYENGLRLVVEILLDMRMDDTGGHHWTAALHCISILRCPLSLDGQTHRAHTEPHLPYKALRDSPQYIYQFSYMYRGVKSPNGRLYGEVLAFVSFWGQNGCVRRRGNKSGRSVAERVRNAGDGGQDDGV